jgi:quercetin dioxygenase-like cupin family protein
MAAKVNESRAIVSDMVGPVVDCSSQEVSWGMEIHTMRAKKKQSPPSGAIVRRPLLTAMIEGSKLVHRVEVKQIDFEPKQRTGLHLHPCPVVGLVLKGQIAFQVEGQQRQILKAGDAFFEPANTKILLFDAMDDPATFVTYYLLGAGEDELIRSLETRTPLESGEQARDSNAEEQPHSEINRQ